MKFTGNTFRVATALLACGVLIASSGVIVVVSTNEVSNGNGLSTYRWEPTSASASNWVHGFAELVGNGHSYMASWSNVWTDSPEIIAPNGLGTGDVYASFDSVRNRYVFVALDSCGVLCNHNVYYWYSNDPERDLMDLPV